MGDGPHPGHPASLLADLFDLAGFGLRLTAAVLDEVLIATINALADRVDVARLLGRVDIDEIVDRVDIDEIVDRVDIEALLARVDLDALVARIDTVGVARHVIDGVDLPEIIRDSTGTMATETVGGLRLQTLHADAAVHHLVDRIIRRNGKRVSPPADP